MISFKRKASAARKLFRENFLIREMIRSATRYKVPILKLYSRVLFSRGLFGYVIINFFPARFQYKYFFLKFTTRSTRFQKFKIFSIRVYVKLKPLFGKILFEVVPHQRISSHRPTLKPYFVDKECDAFLLHKTEYKCNSSSPWEIQDCDEARVEIGAANGVVASRLCTSSSISVRRARYKRERETDLRRKDNRLAKAGPLTAFPQTGPQNRLDSGSVRVWGRVMPEMDVSSELERLRHVEYQRRDTRQTGPGQTGTGARVILHLGATS